MFTKYPEVFMEVKDRMRNNMAMRKLLSFSISKKRKLENIDLLIGQVVFETISVMEDKKLV